MSFCEYEGSRVDCQSRINRPSAAGALFATPVGSIPEGERLYRDCVNIAAPAGGEAEHVAARHVKISSPEMM